MNPYIFLSIIVFYFLLLFLLSLIVGRHSHKQTFYNGDRKSPWFVVAFGMIGTTISGVTFISVPGEVANSSFCYFQFVMGNIVGYILIATLLLPYYYRKNVLSIYTVLEKKMGREGYLTTSGFFILSKVIGASFRLFLATMVIYLAISEPLGISFEATICFCLAAIWLYTFRSGIKTVVWSDTMQTIILIAAVIASIVVIFNQLELTPTSFLKEITSKPESKIFDFEWNSGNNFFKQFAAGIFMTLALNGFDQDIMQKNLTCRNESKARKNMLWFTFFFGIVVFMFLVLGELLINYAHTKGIAIPARTDQLYPLLALNHLGNFIAIMFILGISAAAFSSADSATTALTTTFCVDFLKIQNKAEKHQRKIRNLVHLSFSVLIFIVILLFYKLNNDSVVVSIFKAAGYTYGPILGVFLFLFFINRRPKKHVILPICIASPILTFGITIISKLIFSNFNFGFELIIINASFTVLLLVLFSKKIKKKGHETNMLLKYS